MLLQVYNYTFGDRKSLVPKILPMKIKDKKRRKVQPGIATFADDVTNKREELKAHLMECVNTAQTTIDSTDQLKDTDLFIMGTGGEIYNYKFFLQRILFLNLDIHKHISLEDIRQL